LVNEYGVEIVACNFALTVLYDLAEWALKFFSHFRSSMLKSKNIILIWKGTVFHILLIY